MLAHFLSFSAFYDVSYRWKFATLIGVALVAVRLAVSYLFRISFIHDPGPTSALVRY